MKGRFFDLAKEIARNDKDAEKYAAHLAELFDLILPQRVGEELCSALAERDADRAVSALAAYYRKKPSVAVASLTASGSYSESVADRAVLGQFSVVGVEHTFEGGEVDFLFNPTEEKGPLNHEWLWQLNRHNHFADMARAYTATGDEKYAVAFRRQLLAWIAQTEIPAEWNTPGSAFRTIECGLRLHGAWQVAFDGFRKSDSVDDLTLLLMIASMHRQAVHLVEHPRTGNWLMTESNGLFTFSALFPELSDSESGRALAAKRLLGELEVQLLPDGMQYELSPDYHRVVFQCALSFCQLSIALGKGDEIPDGYRALLKNAANAAILLSTPAQTQPRTNDTFTVSTAACTRGTEAILGDDPVHRYFNTRRAEGTPPTEGNASAYLPYAGLAAMRSDWGPDATYLCFDVGPLGIAHSHQDKLNIHLYKGSTELLYDDGGGQYDKSEARAYALSGYGHNTVLVDGLAQNRSEPRRVTEPIDADWTTSERFDYAFGVYEDGFGPEQLCLARHRREVLFVKPDFFCVTDTLTSRDSLKHDYELLLHMDTESVRPLPELPNAMIAEFGGDSELIVVAIDSLETTPTLSAVSGRETPTLRGWYNGRNDKCLHKATTVARTACGERDWRFTTLLFPVCKGDAYPTVLQNADGTLTVTFKGKTVKIDPLAPKESI